MCGVFATSWPFILTVALPTEPRSIFRQNRSEPKISSNGRIKGLHRLAVSAFVLMTAGNVPQVFIVRPQSVMQTHSLWRNQYLFWELYTYLFSKNWDANVYECDWKSNLMTISAHD